MNFREYIKIRVLTPVISNVNSAHHYMDN